MASAVGNTDRVESPWLETYKLHLAFFIILAGALFRIRFFLANRSFWLDELFLANNLVHRSFLELLKPLDYAQASPIGFLWVQKCVAITLGYAELPLRTIPLIAGMGLLPLFFVVAQRLVGLRAAFIGLLILSTEKRMIRYSSEFKQYATDSLVGLWIMWGFWWGYEQRWSGKCLVVLSLSGIAAVWFSYPSIFVLAGGGFVMALLEAHARDWKALSKVALIGAVTGAAFAAHYWWFMKPVTPNPHLQTYWQDFFMPLPPQSWHDLLWFPLRLRGIFEDTIKTGLPELSLAIFLFGCLIMARRHRVALLLALAPFPIALLTSGLHKYPFGDRLLLYTAPQIILILAMGLEGLYSNRRSLLRWCAVALLIACVAENTGGAFANLYRVKSREEVKPVLQYIVDHRQSSDSIYVTGGSWQAFMFYAPKFHLENVPIVMGSGFQPEKLERDLNKLQGEARVWLLLSHDLKTIDGVDNEAVILRIADKHGKRVSQVNRVGAAAYLYDFSVPLRPSMEKIPIAPVAPCFTTNLPTP